MTLINTQEKAAIEFRRATVATLLIRQPRITQREIVAALEHQGQVNPKDNKPWSQATISTDIRALTERWEKSAAQDIAVLKGQQLARLYELLAVAWEKRLYDLALKTETRISALLGLDAPVKSELTGPDGRDIFPVADIIAAFQKVGGTDGSADSAD